MKDKLQLEILLSCMNQQDLSLVSKSGIKGNVLIINQCESEAYIEESTHQQSIRMFSTIERGLSRSRNMAIKLAKEDICLICDDDEHFFEGYEKIILQYFEKLPEADIIAFNIENKKTKLKNKVYKLNRLESLRIASYQIAFRRKRILEKGVFFDVFMGAGSGNGCGEENKFLLDCMNAGLSLYYVPQKIGILNESESTWFFGYDEKFFEQRGAATRYMLGLPLAAFYGVYYLLTKRHLYKQNISFLKAFKALSRGIYINSIVHQKKQEKMDG